MDDWKHSCMSEGSEKRTNESQRSTHLNTVMVCLAFLILLQTLVLNIALEGYMGDQPSVILPAIIISGLCFSGSCWLVRSVFRM